MNLFKKNFKRTILVLLLLTASFCNINAQERPPDFIRKAVRNTEKMLNSEDLSAIEAFIEESMVKRKNQNRDSLIKELSNLRNVMHGINHNVAVEAETDGFRMIFSNGKEEKHLKVVMDFDAEAVSGLYIINTPAPLNLTAENISENINLLKEEGMSGVIYVKINGEVIIRRAFGMANKDLGIPNTINTVFGIGSRPIDFTVAAIYLLYQQGTINLEDKISQYFSDVPEDKSTITIRHLLTGQSGLPDFFHIESDWNPDLAWIDRKTAVNRLFAQDLIFEPGTERRHSHGAFGLLAALIEVVTRHSYYDFIRENFLVPAGMLRTGEYGQSNGLSVSDFAAGGGPQIIGLPNIPPNWGPTSWLIKGSGGMYSTLDDLLKFYEAIRTEKILDAEHNKAFHQPSVNIDGSDRGFELFSAYMPPDSEIYLFLNEQGVKGKMRQLFQALELMIKPE